MYTSLRKPWIAFVLGSFLWMAFQPAHAPGYDNSLPEISVPPGFTVEHLYSPMTADSSSWVSLAMDGKGRLLASDQYGSLYRITPPPIGEDPANTQVEKMDIKIGHANGLLWAFNSLYVMVNSGKGIDGKGSGLYRVLDTDGDDQFDEIRLLRRFEGEGEHGPHGIVLGPDSTTLYLLGGNHTDLPDPFNPLVPPGWQEDGLFPSIKDPRGHAIDRMAPGGWIARTDSTGSNWELFAVGFRNTYDMAFNADGELFAFDSDMEWDLGMPWYRPIRVVHVTSGGEYGWRTGSGKWPAYYPDNLPPITNLGQGSPTGVVMARDAAFPQRYQHGMFVFDWSFGTIYWIDLQPNGASYTGNAEEFLTGVPLPLTDGVIGKDGALYFTTGGRRLDSHLYRVYYSGEGETSPAPLRTDAPLERTLRRRLEAFHGKQDPAAIDEAWPHLNHPDRFVRYAARVAIEHQPVNTWASRVFTEPDPVRRIQGAIALARQGEAAHKENLLKALFEIDYATLDASQQLDLIRAYGLTFIRMGAPSEAWRTRIAAMLDAHYPADQEFHNRELSRILAYLEAPEAIEKTLTLLESYADGGQAQLLSKNTIARSKDYGPVIARMLENAPQPQEIAYAHHLSYVKTGWTRAQRERYFRWFFEALSRSGGESYKGFLDAIRSIAIENLPEEDKEALAELTGTFTSGTSVNLADLPQPMGPGRMWNIGEVQRLMWEQMEDEPRDFEQGKRMYAAALCQACHAMQGVGGNIGPDLTQVGTRFSRDDVLHAIFSPSAIISDQYAATVLTLADGSTVVGRIVSENDREVRLNQNPFDAEQTVTVLKADIQSREASPVSIMPPRLLDRLNEKEVLDLMAYLLSGGDPSHEYFAPKVSQSTQSSLGQ